MGAVMLQAVSSAPTWVAHVSDLLRTTLALGFVCVLAWLVLRFVAARGLGKVAAQTRLQVIERLSLDAQRSLVIVRVEQRRLLIGLGAGAAPQLIAELDGDARGISSVLASSHDELVRAQPAQKSDATH